MADTIHTLPTSIVRHQAVQNRRKGEQAALDDLIYYDVPFRHRNRLASYMTQIPEPWDDKAHSAWGEYHNKHYYCASNKWKTCHCLEA